MAEEVIRVALISGAMYDGLYQSIPEFTKSTGTPVHVAFRGTHPELNSHLSSLTEIPYDLVSTHTKYAPSQQAILCPLKEPEPTEFFPAVLEMARIDGKLYGIPRNFDAKLLHYRTDQVVALPETWDQLCETARALSGNGHHGFVLTGTGSGLFGMFYELAEMGGASLFPADKIPKLNNQGGVWALSTLRTLYRSGAIPAAVVKWHYDEAHQYFRSGCAAMICDFPGFYSSCCAEGSAVRGKFALARMPAGPSGVHKAYAGAHTFALTHRGTQNPRAVELLAFLTSPERQLLEAHRGSVPVRPAVMDAVRAENPVRWDLLEEVINHDALVPPRYAYYPEIEEILWQTVQQAMIGAIDIEAALWEMEHRIAACHRRNEAGSCLDHATSSLR